MAVRAVNNANARYRLRLSTGIVQDLALNDGAAVNQVVAGNDWRYYRFELPPEPQPNWQLSFTQQSGDVVMYMRDTVPPGNGATTAAIDYKDWTSDAKNNGPYGSFDNPGTYTFKVPPLRPGTVYYVGFRAKSDSSFSLSSSTSGAEIPLPAIIPFYGGSVSNTRAPYTQVAYRVITPADAFRWRHTSVHPAAVQVYIENGSYPAKSNTDDFRSLVANSGLDRFLTSYPWLPDQSYFLYATNTSALTQNFVFTLNGSNNLADDDNDGMPDPWELQHFGVGDHRAYGRLRQRRRFQPE